MHTDIDECARNADLCSSDDEHCENIPGGYICTCNNGFFRDDNGKQHSDGSMKWSQGYVLADLAYICSVEHPRLGRKSEDPTFAQCAQLTGLCFALVPFKNSS